MSLSCLAHGDQARIRFDPPYRDEAIGPVDAAVGEIMTVVGQVYLASSEHKSSLGLPHLIRLDDHPSIVAELLESHDQKTARLKALARGEIVFPKAPTTAWEIEDHLDDLAGRIATVPGEGLHSRRDELRLQFDDIADLVCLAKRKRTYLLTRSVIGQDFHPWTTRDPRVFRIETERPLPSDFELDRTRRGDRTRRLEEAVRIFGEAEREVRQLASRLRAEGYDVRRPHPNAQELLIRIRWSRTICADMVLASSQNGLWSVSAAEPDNKTKARGRDRLLREGHVATLRGMLGLS